MRLARIVLGILALAALAAAGVGASGAAFTSASENPGGAISSAPDWTGPIVTLEDPGSPIRGTVALTASASDERSVVASVAFQRRPASGGSWADIGSATQSPWTANWNTAGLADGAYDLRAVATDAAGNSTTSAVIAARLVDNTAPTATLADPGSPLSGTVALDVSADDAGSGIARVGVQSSPAGAGEWTEVGSETDAPFTVDWDTTPLQDGAYDLRVIVLDTAGNAGTSAVITDREVANTWVVLDDPGQYLRGDATFSATASGGVEQVEFQARPAGTSSWSPIGYDATSPYSTTFDTTGAPDGTYEVRAAGATPDGYEYSLVRTVIVDNTAPRGTGVQGMPKTGSGSTSGRVEAGDALALTWSEKIDPATLVSGWSGAAATTVYARLTHSSSGDRIEFFRNSAGTQATGLGLVNTGGNFIDSGSTVTFASTATLNAAGTAATITLGTASGNTSGLNTVQGSTTLRWTPSAAALDLAGNASATTQVTESGSADRDF